MLEPINERVGVVTAYDQRTGRTSAIRPRWRGRAYRTSKLGYHRRARQSRMPAMPRREDEAARLDPLTDTVHLDEPTRPYAPEAMVRCPVSPLVNNAHNDAPELLQPLTEGGS